MRPALLAIFAVLLFGSLAPFVEIGGLHGTIQHALEAFLGRKVDLGNVHLTLFSGPGLSLENVVIHEDPRYGLEPFASVPTLAARVRLDKLLFGQLRFSSLRLEDATINLVKSAQGADSAPPERAVHGTSALAREERKPLGGTFSPCPLCPALNSDQTWNVVELVERLSGPRRTPLNLFPAVELSDARINFKFGTRKTTLYIADSDLAIYPERSGKLYVQFSGSPARTDRAGNGFGHFRGTANWYINPSGPSANQLEADVNLDPSNLSELTTLFEGHDIGVHGTVSSHLRIQGPAAALRIAGDVHLEDVHRWDLLPMSGEEWWIRCQGKLDLASHQFQLRTVPSRKGEATPVAVEMHVNNFLTKPAWSVFAMLKEAPLKDLLPLGRRMGLVLPQDLVVKGMLNGVVGYSNRSGLAGAVSIRDAVAALPDTPPLRVAAAYVAISPDRIHFEPATVETSAGGDLEAGGDYYLSDRRVQAVLKAGEFPLNALKSMVGAWLEMPPAIAALQGGLVSGECTYAHALASSDTGNPAVPSWSGQMQVANAVLDIPGLAFPLKRFNGHVAFDGPGLKVNRFSATLGRQAIYGSYQYTPSSRRTERVHLEMPSADLSDLEAALDPALEAQNLLARLRFTRRAIPSWMAGRNLEGDLRIDRFSVDRNILGPFSSHFIWQGTNLRFPSVQLNLPEGLIRAHGNVSLTSYTPRYRFDAKVTGFPWAGGLLNAEGELETSGVNGDSLHNLHATGNFTANGLGLSADDEFERISGLFDFSDADDWPKLRLSDLLATRDDGDWNGTAASESNGKLLIDLERNGRQLHLISSLVPENSGAPPSLTSSTVPQ